MKYRICIVTSSRADYGLLKPLIRRFNADIDIEFSLIVTGMHLCPEFGNTYQEIESDDFEISKKIVIQESADTSAAMSKTMGNALYKFSDYFESNKPDLLIVLGDRYEIMAVCCTAVNERIPIAHIHGGETSVGAVDEFYRHSITKMSILHFVSCEAYRKRVIQLGEQPERVFNVGALGVENALRVPILPLHELEQDIGFPLKDKLYAVVTLHPVTLEDNTGAEQLREMIAAMDAFSDMKFIITKSNSDAGGRKINRLWEEYVRERGNFHLVTSLGVQRYLSMIKHASVIIGNSSSGIIEGPTIKTPSVNIGDRQKGRIMADSIISCPPLASDIESAISKAQTPEFQELASNAENPYGDGGASEKIVEIIKNALSIGICVQKVFCDIA